MPTENPAGAVRPAGLTVPYEGRIVVGDDAQPEVILSLALG